MSEVNYRRNGKKYSSCGPSKGRLAPKALKLDAGPVAGPKPKSSRERRVLKKARE